MISLNTAILLTVAGGLVAWGWPATVLSDNRVDADERNAHIGLIVITIGLVWLAYFLSVAWRHFHG